MIKLKDIIKESKWSDRKWGDPLPTLEDVMKEKGDVGRGVDPDATDANIDKDLMDKQIVYRDKDTGEDKTISVRGALKQGEDHPAYDDAKKMVDKEKGGNDKEEPKGKALGGGDFERDFDDEKPEDEPSNDIEYHEYEEIRSPLEIEDFLEKHGDKLSDKQKDKIHDLGYDLEDAEGEMATGQISDDEYEEKVSDIQGKIADVVDTTAGDPDDAWDDEEGRAKPFGGDTGKDADSDSDDNSGGKLVAIDYQEDGDTWQVELDGLDNDVVVPGSEADTEEEAEEVARKMAALGDDEFDPDKHGLDKYSSDIEDDSKMGEITINGKKYKPIKESVEPTVFDPFREAKKQLGGLYTRMKGK